MLKTGRIMGVACLEFRGENFRGWRKNREIRESFLPPWYCKSRNLCAVRIRSLLATLDATKSTGCDGISPKMLKSTASSIAFLLSN